MNLLARQSGLVVAGYAEFWRGCRTYGKKLSLKGKIGYSVKTLIVRLKLVICTR